ncbi:cupin domain-containing protein [Streptomyces europaeiscabiei]|uniref:cupin domain-containing protein n=1 Tax=Streptomyces europaeiscabiei TaxID=146819 RepID=UPI0029BCFA00|nr:cupin domain-containing protein [Streptomyces europaeiscabiei]MDX3690569.1 cupin domain-containing protein [Streptomyces europaeiscabiei]
MTPEDLIAHYGLEPIPREGGRFRQTWAGPERADGRPEGTAIVALLTTEPGDYSALHRLPGDEIWHFHLGDPLRMLLLAPDGSSRVVVLGPDVLDGQHVQYVVPAGTWMGARVLPGGGGEGGCEGWTLFGCTMAPGFTFEGYEHGDAAELARRYPDRAAEIGELGRA